MDLSLAVFLGLVAVLACNQAVMRVERIGRIPAVFWGTTLLDLLVGVGVLFFGLPGFEAIPAVTWVIGLVFILHVAQNLGANAQWRREDRRAEIDALRAEHDALRESGDPE